MFEMLTRGKGAALQEIRRWTIEDVLKCLEKNGLGDCADVFKKREVVGEVLLELTEGKLALWKRDINQSKIRALVAFVDDLKMHPEKYLLKESSASETENLPTRGFSLRHEFPLSSGHCNMTQNSTFGTDKKQEVKGPPVGYKRNNSPSNSFLDNNCRNVLPQGGPKLPDKPPLFKRPDIGTTMSRNKVFLEKPSNKITSQRSVSPTQNFNLNQVPRNFASFNTASQQTTTENNMEQNRKEPPLPVDEGKVHTEIQEELSHTNSVSSEGSKTLQKPPLFRRPKNEPPVDTSSFHSKEVTSKSFRDMDNDCTRSPLSCEVPINTATNDTTLPDKSTDENQELKGDVVTSGNCNNPVNQAQIYKKQTNGKSDDGRTLHPNDAIAKLPNYRSHLPNQLHSSPSSTDSLSWDTDFEDDEPHQVNISVAHETKVESSNVDTDYSDSMAEPVYTMEENTNCNLNKAYDKVLLPKPPDPTSKTVKNIISTVNIGAIEARVLAEQLDEEFYESFDGENIADVAAIKKAVCDQISEEKCAKNDVIGENDASENNQQNGESTSTDYSAANFVLQTSIAGDDNQTKNPDSPPTPPPRNPTMKLNEANAVLSRLHSSAMSLQEESVHRRNPFDRLPETAGKAASHQSLMISLNNLNLTSGNSSYLHSSWNSKPPSEQNSEAEYEILDGHITSVNTDSLLSEVYESIKEQVQMKGNDEDGYYLQPDPRLLTTVLRSDESSSDDSRNFPLPPKTKVTVLPDVVLPSAPPPSPPRKKSEDSSSSTTSGSGDSMSGRLGGLFRKVISRPQPLLPDHGEKTPTSTPELKKPGSLPPPTTRPPPPVEQRPSAFQRPLPPTPEGKKFQLHSPEKTHNTLLQQTTKTSFKQMPWFHNIDRRRAEELLSNSEDGYFVIRPSTQTSNPLTLTLWYKNRIFNISVRHRSDGKYALGTEKPNEQSFNSIEEMVAFYQSEKLVLYSAGERAGKVLLTNSPKRTS